MNFRSMSLVVVVGLMLSFLVGCPKYTPYQKATIEPAKSVVYVFRPESPFNRGGIYIVEVNGTQHGRLINQAYMPIPVDPGNVEVKILDNLYKTTIEKLTLKTQAGKAYFVRVSTKILGKVTLDQLDESEGVKELGGTVLYEIK